MTRGFLWLADIYSALHVPVTEISLRFTKFSVVQARMVKKLAIAVVIFLIIGGIFFLSSSHYYQSQHTSLQSPLFQIATNPNSENDSDHFPTIFPNSVSEIRKAAEAMANVDPYSRNLKAAENGLGFAVYYHSETGFIHYHSPTNFGRFHPIEPKSVYIINSTNEEVAFDSRALSVYGRTSFRNYGTTDGDKSERTVAFARSILQRSPLDVVIKEFDDCDVHFIWLSASMTNFDFVINVQPPQWEFDTNPNNRSTTIRSRLEIERNREK